MKLRDQITLLTLLCLAFYLAEGCPHPEVDTTAAPYTAWSLAKLGCYDLRPYPFFNDKIGHVHDCPDGRRISIRPFGDALFMLPVVTPVSLFRANPPGFGTMNYLGKIAGTLAVTGSAIMFFFVCRRLTPRAAWPATILFAFGTCLASVASQAIWNHGPSTFWLCAALFVLTSPERHSSWRNYLAGLFLGLAVCSRSTTAFFAIATTASFLLQRRWRDGIFLALGGCLPAIALLVHNDYFYGNLFVGGYVNDDWVHRAPLWFGVSGLVFSPSRGIFVFTPALLLLPLGVRRLLKQSEPPTPEIRPLLLSWLGAAVAMLLFYARWHDWCGGWCFGPRFMCEAMPVLCLLVAYAYDSMSSPSSRAIAALLVALSVSIHLVGIYGHHELPRWCSRHATDDYEGRFMFDLQDSQIEAYAREVLRMIAGKRATD